MIPRVLHVVALGCLAMCAGAEEGRDAREARAVREDIYPAIEHLPEFGAIRETFEMALSDDAGATPGLVALLSHSEQDVASTAAIALGRFANVTASDALQACYATDTRPVLRASALVGLARMKDPATGPLALTALQGDDRLMQGAALGALEALGDSAHASAIIQYYEQHPAELNADRLQSLGELGDAPGSLAVRDWLLAAANDRSNRWDARYGAAVGLHKMGHTELVKPILDIARAKVTHATLTLLKRRMGWLADSRGVTVKGQPEVDALLRDVEISERYRSDDWQHLIRARYVSEGVFDVVSDGPDMSPDTLDDLSTSETLEDYLDRVFADQFDSR